MGSIERDGEPHWTLEAHLIDDLRIAMTGSKKHPSKPHPQRPLGRRPETEDRDRLMAAGRRRRAERQRLIEAGEIT